MGVKSAHQLGYAKPESHGRALRHRLPYIVSGALIGILTGILCSFPARRVPGRVFDFLYQGSDDANRRVNEAFVAMIVVFACIAAVGIIGAWLGNRRGRTAR